MTHPQKRPVTAIVYDAEIAAMMPVEGEPRVKGLQYCKGWDDWYGMGVSVVCAIDLKVGIPYVFLPDNLSQFSTLIDGRAVIGFNNTSFDDKLLLAAGRVRIEPEQSLDLLALMRVAAGEPPVFTKGVTKKGRTLNDVARTNIGLQKQGQGARAPQLWQEQRTGELITYCMRDVALLARLIRKLPALIDPPTGEMLDISLPPQAYA